MNQVENKTVWSLAMPEETWHGIPRNEIPWFPKIDYRRCVNCGKCAEYCKLGAYEFEEKDGEWKTVVKNPFNCVVLCTGCDSVCPEGAISHPSKKETREAIKGLRKKHRFQCSGQFKGE